jgi:hypothetical protein
MTSHGHRRLMARVPNWPCRRIPSAAVNLIRPAVLAQELLANGLRPGPGGVADRATMCPKVSVGGGSRSRRTGARRQGSSADAGGTSVTGPPPAARSPAWPGPGGRFGLRLGEQQRGAVPKHLTPRANGSRPTGPAGAGSGHLPTSCRYFFGGGKRSERTDHEGCRRVQRKRGLEDAVRAERPGIPGPWRMAATRGGGTP